MKPDDMLASAEKLVDDEALGSATGRRAAALLARQALETAVAHAVRPALPHEVSFTALLLALRRLAADETQGENAAYAWAALSSATHIQGGSLALPREAVLDLIALVRRFVEAPPAGAVTRER